ncbi:hypothetical protein CAZ17_34190, partial [Pseudomonas aeruginosa]
MVAALGPGVSGLAPGDRVAYATGPPGAGRGLSRKHISEPTSLTNIADARVRRKNKQHISVLLHDAVVQEHVCCAQHAHSSSAWNA